MFKKRMTSIFLIASIFMSTFVVHANAENGGTEGTKPWMNTQLSAEERTELLLDEMTMKQKIQQIAISRFNENDTGETVVIKRGGTSKYQNGEFEPQGTLPGCEWQDTGRQIQGIDELGIPTIRMTNGGTGVKGGSCGNDPLATGLPSSLAMAATFDRKLNYEAGRILGEETRAFAHHVMLGPGMNLIRHPYNGRNYEYFSEDPYLTGVLATEQVKAIQDQGVQAQLKHLAGNEQETERWTMGVQVPSQAMNELYMLPFEMTVKDADPASVMCSFPDVNGTFACDSSELLQDALRDNWGFDGYVMSDRRAIHDTVAGIKAGMNVELDWAPQYYTEEKIQEALDSGQVTEDDIDNLLRPRYIKMIEFGHMDEPYDKFMPEIVDPMANGASALKIAEEGSVLLKNDNGFLPLDGEPKSIALIGVEWFAGEAKMSPRSVRDNNENVVTPYTVTPKEGLESVIKELGYDTEVKYNDGRDPKAAAKLAAKSDVVLLMIGDNPHETADRQTLGFPAIDLDEHKDREDWVEQEPLIDAVLKANAENTAVVLKTSGTVIMPWLDEVPAVLSAWFPGMEDGNAVANLLYGKVNPSGKLPMTWGANEREAAFATKEQYPGTRVDTGKAGGPGPYGDGSDQLIAKYTEGLEMGYRWYEANNVEPVFPFGYGLSYTTFEYNDLKVKKVQDKGSLSGIDVSFTITNTGDVAGKEAAQVYMTLPNEAGQPAKRLVNFEKVSLEPGKSERVTVRINHADSNHPFSYFVPEEPDNLANWADGEWATADGKYRVHVGGSSADTPLEKNVSLNFKLSKDKSKDKEKSNNSNNGNNVVKENNANNGNNSKNSNKENKGNKGNNGNNGNNGTPEPKSEKPSFDTKIVNVKVVKEKVTKALESTATVEFKDVQKTNWSASAIELAAKIGFVRGYADGSFKSDAKVTRAEFATMLVKALGIESKGDSSFADTKGNWASDAINALKSNGIINGYADGTFKPNNQISRAETVTILSKVMNMSNSADTSKSFKDISGSWAEDAINKLSAAGIVGGKGEGKFDPNSTTSRAESVTMILRVLNVNIDLGIKL